MDDTALRGLDRFNVQVDRAAADTRAALGELANYHGHSDGGFFVRFTLGLTAASSARRAVALAGDVKEFLAVARTERTTKCCGPFEADTCGVFSVDGGTARPWHEELVVVCSDRAGHRLTFVVDDGAVVQVQPGDLMKTALAILP